MPPVPAALATLTIRPFPRATIPGNTAWQHKNVPRTFTSRQDHHRSGSTCQDGPSEPPMPALLTSRSIEPNFRSTALTVSTTSRRSDTSARNASARPPASSTCRTVSASSSSVRATTATDIPVSARPSANARPRPRPPPVISAVRPFEFSDITARQNGRFTNVHLVGLYKKNVRAIHVEGSNVRACRSENHPASGDAKKTRNIAPLRSLSGAILMAMAISGATLAAHDMWIEPATFSPNTGQIVGVRLRVGQDLLGDPLPRDPRLINEFV